MKDNPICSIKTTPNTYNHFSSKQLDEIVVNELIPVITLVMHLVTDMFTCKIWAIWNLNFFELSGAAICSHMFSVGLTKPTIQHEWVYQADDETKASKVKSNYSDYSNIKKT